MFFLTKNIHATISPIYVFFRFVEYNGGIGPQQLLWLEGQLAEASRAGQRVVLFGHLPTHPGASEAKCLLWNFDEVSTSSVWIPFYVPPRHVAPFRRGSDAVCVTMACGIIRNIWYTGTGPPLLFCVCVFFRMCSCACFFVRCVFSLPLSISLVSLSISCLYSRRALPAAC